MLGHSLSGIAELIPSMSVSFSTASSKFFFTIVSFLTDPGPGRFHYNTKEVLSLMFGMLPHSIDNV